MSTVVDAAVGGATRSRGRGRRLALTVVAAAVGLAFILPAVWILVGSLRPTEDIFASLSPLSWSLFVPEQITFANYVNLFTGAGFGRALLNSVVVCVSTVVFGVVMCALAAYALSVLRFRGRGIVFVVVVVSFMVPFETIAIPLAGLFTDWQLDNTFLGLVLPGLGNGLAIFNLRQHFLGIPPSLREAAVVDGASEFRILTQIYLPLSGSALVNSALLIFLGQWTAYLWPLLITTDLDMFVAPISLARTFSEHAFDFGQNFAGAVLLSLVPAILMFVLQRFFTRSIAETGSK
ncbi:MAG TPA: carbohydrate ABC transporter permease [Pseudonocardia sp.]|nr:carbohydrate ABC transporter permease [Pseudonocardia sp.]